jgi:hypothetical protein
MMGFYRYSSSPYDVQARNGGRFTFETLAKRYEDTKPIQGKRKDQNIRPIGQRNRAWERMVKVSDTEYYITCDAYQHRSVHTRSITWKQIDGMDYLTIHTPRAGWNGANADLYPRAFSSSSIYWFYDMNMPVEFGMTNYKCNKYVRYADKYYTIEKGDITFQRKIGTTDWQPLVVHREFKHTIDRKKTKELREITKSFKPYFDVMCDMVDSKWEYGNPIVRAIHDGELRPTTPEQALALFKPSQDGDVPNEWLRMAEIYKQRIREHKWVGARMYEETFRKDKVLTEVNKDLFAIVRPCKEEAVELGKLSHDRYKKWYN